MSIISVIFSRQKYYKCKVRFSTSNFYALAADDLTTFLLESNQPAYRGKQIRKWVYERGCLSFDDMKDLPKDLRSTLSKSFHLGSLQLQDEGISKDGTIKRAYKLHDGQLIESVLMPYKDGRRTACISSQAGCGMGCVFCATGQMGFSRQLTSTEIFEQVQIFSGYLQRKGERLSNVVFMGMGEPFNNYSKVLMAIRRMSGDLGIGARHITVSTVGIVPRIRKLSDEGIQIGLAISLHHATDEKRSKLMPVNDRYPLTALMDACRYYIEKTNRRISFEWALIRGDTDTADVAHTLGQLLSGLLCHVNVIPLNPTEGFAGKPSSKRTVEDFIGILHGYGIAASSRLRRGVDINAGCGQLKSALLERQKSRPQLAQDN